MRVWIPVILSLCSAAAFATEAYRWVDKDGVVHYGDRPQAGARPVDINPGSGKGPTPETLNHAADCEKKKAELVEYRAAPGLNEVDALGRKHDFTPDERRQFLDNFQKKVDEACAPPKAS